LKIRVAVYSDEPVAVSGLRAVLEKAGEFEVVHLVCSPSELESSVPQARPEVVLLDLDGQVSLAGLTQLVRGVAPCPVVLWARDVPIEFVYQAVQAGVKGILTKKLAPELITQCLKRVATGEVWFERGLAQRLLEARTVRLTKRESQLFVLVAQGLTNREIARTLSLSPGTVRFYLTRLFRKMLVSGRAELASYGARMVRDSAPRPQEVSRLLQAALPQLVVLESERGGGRRCN
jgi:DNA-binding NarL/FixJ family response regulator